LNRQIKDRSTHALGKTAHLGFIWCVLREYFTTKWRQAEYLHFILIFSLALLVRAIYILQIDASPLFAYPAVDGETYVLHAYSLAAGNWLGHGQGPFWQPPFYPYALGIIKLFAADSFFYAIRCLQALCGALTCCLIYLLAARWYSTQVGLLAALAACFCGPLIFFDGEVLPTSLATVLSCGGLLLLDRALERNAPRAVLGAGLVFGLAALTVASVLSFVAAAALWIYWKKRTLLQPIIFLLGVIIAIAPVSWRNYAIGGDIVLISFNSGVNFYIGNNAQYEKTIKTRPGWEWDELIDQATATGGKKPSERSAYFWRKAISHIKDQPLHSAYLQLRKTREFLSGDEVGRNQDIYYWRNYSTLLAATLWKWGVAFPFGLLSPLALLGLGLTWRRRYTHLGIVFVLAYSAGVIAFFPMARYRIPILPIVLILAAFGICQLWQQFRSGQRQRAILACALVIALGLIANIGSGEMNMEGDAEIHYNLGQAYSKQRQADAARQHFAQSVALDSTYWQAWLNLGSMVAMQGDLERAKDIFRRVAQAKPQRPEAWVNLAHTFLGLNQSEAAARAYEQALKANPRQPRIYAELLQLHFGRGSLAEAKQVLALALDTYPQEREKLLRLFESLRQRAASEKR
jgi:4-amino-4-deoxy-L-arabinose transferase-like glycosyltransferase